MASAPPEMRQHVEQFERYDAVSVLLIRWANHDWKSITHPGRDMLDKEMRKLRKIYMKMNFRVHDCSIPDDNSQYNLGKAIDGFLEKCDTPEHDKRTLLIVQYGGHGKELYQSAAENGPGGGSPVSCGLVVLPTITSKIDDGIPWRNVMFKLLKAKSDILVVIDSCQAAAVARPEGHLDLHNPGEPRTARAELLACAGVEAHPLGPCDRLSFTNQYSELLREMADPGSIGPHPVIRTTMSLHGSLCIDKPTVTISVLVDLARANFSPIVLQKVPRPNQDRQEPQQISALSQTHLSSGPSLLTNGARDRVAQTPLVAGPSCRTAAPPQPDRHGVSAEGSFFNRSLSIPPPEITSHLPLRRPSSPSVGSLEISPRSPTNDTNTLPEASVSMDITAAQLDHLVAAPEKNQSKQMSAIRGILSKHQFIKHPGLRPCLQRVYMQDMTVALAEHCLITNNNGTLSWALSSKPSLAMLMSEPRIVGDRSPNYLGYIRWQENIASEKLKYFQKSDQEIVSCKEKPGDSEGFCTECTSPDVTHGNSYCLLWRMPDHYSPGLEHITLQEAVEDQKLKLCAQDRVSIAKWLIRASLKLSPLGLSNGAGIDPNNVVFFQLTTGFWDFSNPYLFGFGDTLSGIPRAHGPSSLRIRTAWVRRSQKREWPYMFYVLCSIGLWKPINNVHRSWRPSSWSKKMETFSKDLEEELGDQFGKLYSEAITMFKVPIAQANCELFEQAYTCLDRPVSQRPTESSKTSRRLSTTRTQRDIPNGTNHLNIVA